jgi:phospholipase/carboxylesterase
MDDGSAADAARQGRLHRPATGGAARLPAGRGVVEAEGRRVGLRYVPAAPAERLLIVLHGAGGTAENALGLLRPYADDHRLLLFAPQSADRTWDMIRSGYGPDVVRIQAGLDRVLGAHRVAVPALAVAGFSDGASYAASLGLINGDIIDAVLAFSPGFAAPTRDAGAAAFFVSHGRSDPVLPIDRCSRRLVPALRRAGHRVAYHEFDGGHEVPPAVIDAALGWLAGAGAER